MVLKVKCPGVEKEVLVGGGLYRILTPAGCLVTAGNLSVQVPDQIDIRKVLVLEEASEPGFSGFLNKFNMKRARDALDMGKIVKLEELKSVWHEVASDFGPHLHGVAIVIGGLGFLMAGVTIVVVGCRIRKAQWRKRARENNV